MRSITSKPRTARSATVAVAAAMAFAVVGCETDNGTMQDSDFQEQPADPGTDLGDDGMDGGLDTDAGDGAFDDDTEDVG